MTNMKIIIGLLCVCYVDVHTSCSKTQNTIKGKMMARTKRASCCFVDIFCYATCYLNAGYNLQSLVPVESRTSDRETRRPRHHRHHRHRNHNRHRVHQRQSFRTKRETHDNILWKKLRKSFEGKGDVRSMFHINLVHR